MILWKTAANWEWFPYFTPSFSNRKNDARFSGVCRRLWNANFDGSIVFAFFTFPAIVGRFL